MTSNYSFKKLNDILENALRSGADTPGKTTLELILKEISLTDCEYFAIAWFAL